VTATKKPQKPKADVQGYVYDDARHTGRTMELVCALCGALINPTRASACASEADVSAHAMIRHTLTTVDLLWADTAQHLTPDAFKSHRLFISAGNGQREPGEWLQERCADPWCIRPAGDHPEPDEVAAAAYRVTVLEDTTDPEETEEPQPIIVRRRAQQLADARQLAAGGHWPLPLIRTEARLDPLGARRVTIRFHGDGSRAA
jgi:hypothetical protein